MTVLQLISRERPEGQAELSVVLNPYEREPDSFENATDHPLLIGSQDLILLAAGLCSQGFRVMEAILTDRNFTRLGDEDSLELAEHLAARINSSNVQDLNKFMRAELPGIYLESVRLLDASKRGTVLLRQEGIVIASPNVRPEELTESVRTAAKWAYAS
jgi:hypothetical protein